MSKFLQFYDPFCSCHFQQREFLEPDFTFGFDSDEDYNYDYAEIDYNNAETEIGLENQHGV